MNAKKNEKRFWLIDPGNLVLYRVIDMNNEEAIHIKDNKLMKDFMCMDKSEAELLIEEMNDAVVW